MESIGEEAKDGSEKEANKKESSRGVYWTRKAAPGGERTRGGWQGVSGEGRVRESENEGVSGVLCRVVSCGEVWI